MKGRGKKEEKTTVEKKEGRNDPCRKKKTLSRLEMETSLGLRIATPCMVFVLKFVVTC